MHRIWEYDVKEKVRPAGNELRVVLHSPTKFIRQAFQECRTLGNDDTLEGFVHIRKAHYMFGWDWGPRLPDAGIWRPVKLLAFDHARLDGVYITQKHEPAAWPYSFVWTYRKQEEKISAVSEGMRKSWKACPGV